MLWLRNTLHKVRYDVLMLGILCVAAWKLTCGLEYFMDIGLSDESNYLSSGAMLSAYNISQSPEYGPLYTLWYYLLSLFQPDRIRLYYLNYKVLTGLLPIVTFLLLRRYHLAVTESGCLAGIILLSHANLPVWPKVGHLAALISLVFFLIATYTDSFGRSTLIVSVGALLSSYVRPELFMAYLLLLGLSVMILVCKKQWFGKNLYWLVSVLLFSILCMSFLGIPSSPRKERRSVFAFSQHFSVNWVTWNKSDLNPWTNCEKIMSDNFGAVHSIFEAFQKNPHVFLKHLVTNSKNIGRTFITLVSPKYNRIFLPNNKRFYILEITLLFGMIGVYVYSIRDRWFGKLSLKFQQHKNLLVQFSLYSIPGIMAAIIIFPREHYLLLQSMFFLIAIACIFIKTPYENYVLANKYIYILGFLLIAFTPTSEDAHPYQVPGQYQYNLKTIRFLQALGVTAHVNMLETVGGGYSIYAGDNYTRILEIEKQTSFEEFRREKNLDMIVLNDALHQDIRFKDDPEWQHFLTNLEEHEFIKMTIAETPFELLVKKALITPNSNE